MTEGEKPPAGEGDEQAAVPDVVASLPQLSSLRRAVTIELERLDTQRGGRVSLHKLYLGGLFCLQQRNNPEQLATSAHCIRELIEKAPRQLGAVLEDPPPPLRIRVREFGVVLSNAMTRSPAFEASIWNGAIDDHIREVLVGAEKLVSDADIDQATRRDQTRRMLNVLSPGVDPPPGEHGEQVASSLLELERYFQDVSHHRIATTEEEFERRLDDLGELLLVYLRPREVEIMSNLDAIISEAEGAAES